MKTSEMKPAQSERPLEVRWRGRHWSAEFVLADPNGNGCPFVKVVSHGVTNYLRCVPRSDRARCVTPRECKILRDVGIVLD